MFNVGDLVKVDESEVKLCGIPVEEVSGMLVVVDLLNAQDWNGSPLYEVRNSDGDYYGFNANALQAL